MKPVLTAEEYRRVDQAHRGDMATAMERAGHAVALAAVRRGAVYGKRVAILAGAGNNGGDGYVAARHLKERGVGVDVHALAPPATDLARAAADRAIATGVPVRELGSPVEAKVGVDAVRGGAARPALPGEVLAWMETEAPVVAVDFPTGLDPDTGAVADRAFVAVETVTFGCLKTGHVRGSGPDHCGELTVVDIGISGGEPSMYVAEETDAPRPPRQRTSHKWSAGAVLVVGGSEGLIGACMLAGRAALGFGAGSVHVATPEPGLAQQTAPELPAHDLAGAVDLTDRFKAGVAGPGVAEADIDRTVPIVSKAQRVVLDAGGLTSALLGASRQNGAEVVLTPHDAEFQRLASVGAGAFSIRSFASREGAIVLRKGNPTMVSDGGLPVLVTSGGPELASMGTGDVLSGMIAALWARGLSGKEAAISGAYWHGVAGAELAAEDTLTADGLVDRVGRHAW